MEVLEKLEMGQTQKVTVLLGAGASIPFLRLNGHSLTTPLIATELVQNLDRWKKIWNLFCACRSARYEAASFVDQLNLDDAHSLVCRIYDLLNRSNMFPKTNFEYLIHIIDKSAIFLKSHANSEVTHLDAMLLCLCDNFRDTIISSFEFSSDPDGWGYVPSLVREVLFSIILDAWDEERSNWEHRANLHREFYSRLLRDNSSVKVYSLNYDPIILEAIRPSNSYYVKGIGNEFCTGFGSKSGFNENTFRSSATRASLSFMHGHVGFVPTIGVGNVALNYNYKEAQSARIKNDVENHSGGIGMKGEVPSRWMVTGLDKFDVFSQNPFAAYIHCFSEDVLNSDLVIVIGVSWGDDHITTFLTNAVYFSPNQRMIIVDLKNPSDVLMSDGSPDIGYTAPLLSKRRDVFPSGSEHWKRLQEALTINGYGLLARKTVLYCKGAEDFYKESDLSGMLSLAGT